MFGCRLGRVGLTCEGFFRRTREVHTRTSYEAATVRVSTQERRLVGKDASVATDFRKQGTWWGGL
jgi:hypothetical protein